MVAGDCAFPDTLVVCQLLDGDAISKVQDMLHEHRCEIGIVRECLMRGDLLLPLLTASESRTTFCQTPTSCTTRNASSAC